NLKKPTQLEEQVITSHIPDLNLRGFAPTYTAVRCIADKLLAARNTGQFENVEQTKAEYSIYNKDVHNFNEVGSIICKITTQLVVTALERRGLLEAISLGNRE
ncbi:hypothetical protein COCC4DRAFT_140807, partial [Bipolaris maydis ATCC 48331]